MYILLKLYYIQCEKNAKQRVVFRSKLCMEIIFLKKADLVAHKYRLTLKLNKRFHVYDETTNPYSGANSKTMRSLIILWLLMSISMSVLTMNSNQFFSRFYNFLRIKFNETLSWWFSFFLFFPVEKVERRRKMVKDLSFKAVFIRVSKR